MRGSVLLPVLLLVLPVIGAGAPTVPPEGPIILIYSGSMPGWGSALCEILDGDPRAEYRCMAVDGRELLSVLLFLPRTRGAVVAPLPATDVKGLSAMLEDFMAQGGAVIGFSPCTDIRREPEMASKIFPFFANQTTGSEKVGSSPVNTYLVGEPDPLVNQELPDTFQLIGEGFLLAEGPDDEALDLLPEDGERIVFYRESRTGAPLVIGYQRAGTGRSVGFSGCRVNEIQRSSSFYGHLAAQEEFVQLFRNAVLWAMQGSQRCVDLEDSWLEILETEGARRDQARLRADEMASRASTGRMLVLVSLWAGAVLACGFVARTLLLRNPSDGDD